MLTLILDTSTERGIVALVSPEKIFFETQLPFGLQNSQFLFAELEKGFQNHALSMSDVELIAVAIGPGSYTGIRVGAIAAKTLAMAMEIPLVGLCTFEGYECPIKGSYAVVIDAKIGGVYWQTGKHFRGDSDLIGEPQISSLEETRQSLRDFSYLITPNATFLKAKLEQNGQNWTWHESYPSAKQMARRAAKKYVQGGFSKSGELELLYMRKTQAELEKLSK